jgi:structural maintenance of chromosome 2
MKASIAEAKTAISEAKARQDEAAKEVKKIEKDMSEFSNNKDSKLAELQKSLETLKRSLTKDSTAIKPLQQDAREAKLEMEQCSGDLGTAKETLEEVDSSLQVQREEIATLEADQNRVKVSVPHNDHIVSILISPSHPTT